MTKLKTSEQRSFGISMGKGFHLTFPNGITLSTQFGHFNYCERKNFYLKVGEEKTRDIYESQNAEIALWDRDGEWITEEMYKAVFKKKLCDDVIGWVDIKDWMKIVKWAMKQ